MTERLALAVGCFDLAYVRVAERDASEEAVRTLEDVTQRVHGKLHPPARPRPLADHDVPERAPGAPAPVSRRQASADRGTLAWSPDGQVSALLAWNDAGHVLSVANADGSNHRVIAQLPCVENTC